MISLWERESFSRYDVIVVGAGITGLSTAISLKEHYPKLRVLVLECGTLPSGASTKNAGFACFGSLTELIHDRQVLGESGMQALVEKRWQGLQKTRTRLGDSQIDLQVKGGFELLDSTNEASLDQLDQINDLLTPLFGKPVFTLANDRLSQFGFAQTKQLVLNTLEGQLNTGKLLKSLWQLASKLGVEVLTGTAVSEIKEETDGVTIHTQDMTFEAKAVALCTNAFTKALLPDLELTPGRGMVMLVNPAEPLRFEGTFHYQEGYYYFRDFYGKLVFGGGRNLAFEEEATTQFGLNPTIEAALHGLLREVILPGVAYQTEMKWSGIMAFGPTKAPIVKQVAPRVFAGVRLGGMGVAIGSVVGADLANQILQSHF